jgi:hypothetical protein
VTNDGCIGSVSQRSGLGGVLLLAALTLAGCAKSSSDDNAAALSSAREAQLRAESELKAVQERNAALLAAATQKAAKQTPVAATPAAAPAPAAPTNPLPDVARIKGDLIGETVRGGVLTSYKFDSLDEIISLKQMNKAVAGNRAEFKLDAVLRKETGSTKRCFAVLNAVYTRTAEGDPWAFSTVRADTFTYPVRRARPSRADGDSAVCRA